MFMPAGRQLQVDFVVLTLTHFQHNVNFKCLSESAFNIV